MRYVSVAVFIHTYVSYNLLCDCWHNSQRSTRLIFLNHVWMAKPLSKESTAKPASAMSCWISWDSAAREAKQHQIWVILIIVFYQEFFWWFTTMIETHVLETHCTINLQSPTSNMIDHLGGTSWAKMFQIGKSVIRCDQIHPANR